MKSSTSPSLRTKAVCILYSAFCVFLFASLPAQADTIDWLGTSSANMTGTPANWGNSTVPTGTDIARWDAASYTNAPSANGAMTIGQLLFTGNNTGGVTFGLSQTLTLNGVSGTGIQVDSGSGAINTGTVAFKIGGDQAWTNNSSNLLTIGGSITNAGNSTAYTLTIGGSGNITTTGVISNGGTVGTLSLTKTGAGKLTLNGLNSTYTGNTTISAGTLSMSQNRIANSGTIFIGDNATFEGTAVVTLTDGQKVVGTGANGNINVAGNGLTLAGNNTLSTSGTLTFNSSRLEVNGTGNEMTGGNLTVSVGVSARSLMIGRNVGSNVFTISGGTFTSASASADLISHTSGTSVGEFIINGGNYVNTTGSLSFGLSGGALGGNLTLTSGSATIGTLIYNTQGNGTGTVNLDGGTLTLGAITSTAGASRTINFNGGQFVASGNLTMNSTLTLNVKDGGAKIDTTNKNVTISGNLVTGGTGGLTKTGSGNLTLSGTNTYTGTTTVSAGILTLSNALALQNSALDTANSITGDATNGLKTTVTTLTLGGLAGNKDLSSVFTTTSGGYASVTALTLNPNSGTVSYSGNITNGASGMSLTKTGAGTQVLSGTNTYTGTTTIAAGTLSATGANSLANTSSINVTGGSAASAKLSIGGDVDFTSKTVNITTANGGSYEKLLNASAAFATYGTASSSLGGNNTSASFLAGTTTTAGTMLTSMTTVSGASNDSIRTSDVFSVSGMNILSGSMTDTFVLQLNYSGIVTGDVLAWNNGGTWTLATAGNTGAGTLAGNYAMSFTDFVTANGGSFNATTMLGAYGVDVTGKNAWAVINHNSEFAVIPEPSTWALLAFSLTTVIVFRRRRNSSN